VASTRRITDAEQSALTLAGADFSVLVLDAKEFCSLRIIIPGRAGLGYANLTEREMKRAGGLA
jgi:hypothetical protein